MELVYNENDDIFRREVRSILARWEPREQFLNDRAKGGDLLGELQRELDSVLENWIPRASLFSLHSIIAYEVGYSLAPLQTLGAAVMDCLPSAARSDHRVNVVNLAVLPDVSVNATPMDGRTLPEAVRIVGRLDVGATTLVLGPGRAWLVGLGGMTAGVSVPGLDLVQGFQEAIVSGGAVPLAGGHARSLLDLVAIYTAFEQVGGAQRCLDGAIAYAVDRQAFGQPIGAFQAVKHHLANIYVEIELAKSNAYRALADLEDGMAADEPVDEIGAILARVSACDAYSAASKAFMHLQGAHGTIWENEAHLHLRRARFLRDLLGGPESWLDRIDLESVRWFSQYYEAGILHAAC